MWMLIAQIVVAITLIVLVIVQGKGTGLSGIFGGSTNYHAKRGVEKTLFYLTIICSILFVALAMLNAI